MKKPKASAPERERQLVVFEIHGEEYALPIGLVREIVRYSPPRATAAATGLIQGMISSRGALLPVADLSSRLGHQVTIDDRTRILVMELAGGALGLIVDTVKDVITVRSKQIKRSPVPGASKGLGDKIAVVGERLILLIDPERVLGSELVSR